PKGSDEEREERSRRIYAANRHAAEVPMQTAREAARLLDEIPTLAEKGNPNAASDAGAAALLLAAAVEGALLNVAINLDGAGDPAFAEDLRAEAARLDREATATRERVLSLVRARF
ncbi:MAG: cyclodeaminase/cyclohydrolase family protein, partial [Acidobacteriota bacterium]|nr:cyclodeaminase/cyclohydrolase family protein [Acidobacteriota bacterium]